MQPWPCLQGIMGLIIVQSFPVLLRREITALKLGGLSNTLLVHLHVAVSVLGWDPTVRLALKYTLTLQDHKSPDDHVPWPQTPQCLLGFYIFSTHT